MRAKADTKLEKIINDLRVQLVTTTDWAFGALFLGRRGGGFGFFFAEDMPQEMRMSLLNDMAQAIEAAKKSFAH